MLTVSVKTIKKQRLPVNLAAFIKNINLLCEGISGQACK
jgi:hypothetical protein